MFKLFGGITVSLLPREKKNSRNKEIQKKTVKFYVNLLKCCCLDFPLRVSYVPTRQLGANLLVSS
jgi:hypothetical protein